MAKADLSADRLRELHHYDPETGLFTRLQTRGGRSAGEESGALNKILGYRVICIDYVDYYAHRLAFLYMTGAMPKLVDHINGIGTDNRWANLRASNKMLNAQNIKKALRSNKLGLLGVCRSHQNEKFVASIRIAGRAKFLGEFDTPEEAHSAYIAAKRLHHEANTL